VSDSNLVMPEKGAVKGKAQKYDASRTWALLGWVGLTFLVVGGADFVLTWYPMDFGNREWEFGTVTASFNGLPVPVMGLGLLLASSMHTGRRWLVGLATVGAFGLLLWVLAAAALWMATVPLALDATPVDVMIGMKKALVKTSVQSLTYPVILGFLGWRGITAIRGHIGSGSVK
jgi:hypothetical protein